MAQQQGGGGAAAATSNSNAAANPASPKGRHAREALEFHASLAEEGAAIPSAKFTTSEALQGIKRQAAAFLRREDLGAVLASRAGSQHAAALGPEARFGEPPLLLLHDDTVRDALASLAARGVLSAPVVGETWVLERWAFGNNEGRSSTNADVTPEGSSLGEFTYFGFVDVYDMVGALCAAAKSHLSSSSSHGGGAGGAAGDNNNNNNKRVLEPRKWSELLRGEIGQKFLNTKLLNILGHDGDLVWKGFTCDRTLYDACSRGLLKVQPHSQSGRSPASVASHRVACFDVRGRVTDIISQTDILKHILEHSSELGDLLNLSLQDLGLVYEMPIVSVAANVPAVEAFAKLHAAGTSCLAVVDEDSGELLSNLSASDLRGVSIGHLETLAMPVGQYLSLVHNLTYGRYTWVPAETAETGVELGFEGMGIARDAVSRLPVVMRRQAHDAIVLRPTATLLHLIELLTRKHVHHVWVVDASGKPITVISTTDVLSCLCGGT
mmetsp:Transcript_2551/g.5647  ORF Transcript_2551/g.5647 Transcript_2551/m.5647 type:complete len:495 (-) Transcript_2551:215-1699(-)